MLQRSKATHCQACMLAGLMAVYYTEETDESKGKEQK